MATRAARVKAVLDAIKDADTPIVLSDRVLNAFTAQYGKQLGIDPAVATPSQKLQIYLTILRQFHNEIVQAAESSIAAEAAREAALEKARNEIDLGSG